MAETTAEVLPEECLSRVVSFTSPRDACRAAVVSAAFRGAADSDLAWENFLPEDYGDVISRSVSPVEFASKKELFCRLSSAALLIDGGKKSFSIDRSTNKKSYMLSARDLSITWSSNSLYWSWKPLPHSRFPEAVELIMVCWLEIHGRIKTGILSPNTAYGAYLVIQQLADRAFGLDAVPSEAVVEVGSYKTQKTLSLKCDICTRQGLKELKGTADRVICPRGDGWLEFELGEFYNDGRNKEEEVKMWFREINGVHLKGGLLVEGIELRPK